MEPRVFRIPSKSDATTTYTVTLDPPTCECAGYAWRKTCAHLARARAIVQAERDEVERAVE